MIGNYFFLPIDCFANAACCLAFLNWSALTCFCDDCLLMDFGDLSPIIDLPFVCFFVLIGGMISFRLWRTMTDSVRYVNNRRSDVALTKVLNSHKDSACGTLRVETVHLFESQLNPQGSIYTKLSSYTLKGVSEHGR